MANILVLGHKGMLGRAVIGHFSTLPEYHIETISHRFGDEAFEAAVRESQADFVINCIGKIPQKHPVAGEYDLLNVELPTFLESTGKCIVHPSTDCEFKGTIPPGEAYTKTDIRDADDEYGMSKACISKRIEEEFQNTKIIRTSIIGHEEATSVALLDWFLSQEGKVRGYTNHYWNGITTLEWAKQCTRLIADWDNSPALNQLGTEKHHSKYDILTIARDVYEKDIEIESFTTEITVNKCLLSDRPLPDLETQLSELRSFFAK